MLSNKSTHLSRYPYLEQFEEEMRRCLKCGVCRADCPLFREIGRESAVARGKIRLMEAVYAGELDLTDGFAQEIFRCLNCLACVEACPSGVRFDDLLLAARAEVASRNSTFYDDFLLRFSLRYGFYPTHFTWSFRELLARMALKGPTRVFRPTRRRARVAYFVGCLADATLIQATIRTLVHNQVEVVVPRGQGCCGMPMLARGRFSIARGLAERNLRVLEREEVDALVVTCGYCGVALGREYHHLLGAGEFSHPVYDISQFLAEIGLQGNLVKTPSRLTYHDPCQLNRGMGVREEPRLLLSRIPGVELVEMDGSGRCCGGGFGQMERDLSLKVTNHKIEAIDKTESRVIVTGCPACIHHLRRTFSHRTKPPQVKHTIEILAAALPA